jgi:NarL family two-component system response regulator LiaR
MRFVLQSYPDMRVVGEAGAGEEALRLVSVLHPQVVLMDLLMPGMGGLAAIRTLHRQAPKIKILVLTNAEGGAVVRDALQAGAFGYHLKGTNVDDLAQAIRSAAQDQPSLDPVAARMLATEATRPSVLLQPLTDRERDVLELLVLGLQNKAIAEELVVTEATVKFHVRSIRRKLQATSRAHIVSMALRHHLVANRPADRSD